MSQIRCFHGNAECRACGVGPEWTAEDERAAVVAYLKALASAGKHHDPFWQHVAAGSWNFAAQMIERGEHRREEEP